MFYETISLFGFPKNHKKLTFKFPKTTTRTEKCVNKPLPKVIPCWVILSQQEVCTLSRGSALALVGNTWDQCHISGVT